MTRSQSNHFYHSAIEDVMSAHVVTQCGYQCELMFLLTGLMATEQKVVLDEWYQWLCREGMVDVDLVVYLRTSPDVVHKRVLARGRPEESTVTKEMLQVPSDFNIS